MSEIVKKLNDMVTAVETELESAMGGQHNSQEWYEKYAPDTPTHMEQINQAFANLREAIAALTVSGEREELASRLEKAVDYWTKQRLTIVDEVCRVLRAPVSVDDAAIKRGAKALHKIAYGDDVPWEVIEPEDRTDFKNEAAKVLNAALQAGRK